MPVRPLDWNFNVVFAYSSKFFGEFEGRAAGGIHLVGMRVIDNLPRGQVLRREQCEVFRQCRRNRKVASRNDADVVMLS